MKLSKLLTAAMLLSMVSCDKTDLVAELEDSAQFTSANICAKMFITNKVRTGPGKKGWIKNDWHSYKFTYNLFDSVGNSLNRGTDERPTVGGDIVNALIDYARVMVGHNNTLSQDIEYGSSLNFKADTDRFSWNLGEVRLNGDLDSPTHLVSTTRDLQCNAIHSVVVYNAAKKSRSASPAAKYEHQVVSYQLEGNESYDETLEKIADFINILDSHTIESASSVIGKANIMARSASGQKVSISESDVDRLAPGNTLSSKQKQFVSKIAENYLNN